MDACDDSLHVFGKCGFAYTMQGYRLPDSLHAMRCHARAYCKKRIDCYNLIILMGALQGAPPLCLPVRRLARSPKIGKSSIALLRQLQYACWGDEILKHSLEWRCFCSSINLSRIEAPSLPVSVDYNPSSRLLKYLGRLARRPEY